MRRVQPARKLKDQKQTNKQSQSRAVLTDISNQSNCRGTWYMKHSIAWFTKNNKQAHYKCFIPTKRNSRQNPSSTIGSKRRLFKQKINSFTTSQQDYMYKDKRDSDKFPRRRLNNTHWGLLDMWGLRNWHIRLSNWTTGKTTEHRNYNTHTCREQTNIVYCIVHVHVYSIVYCIVFLYVLSYSNIQPYCMQLNSIL